MKERHADQGHRKFLSIMKEMTWKERINHIWYYYARYILIAAFVIYMIGDVIYDTFKEKPEQLMVGSAINVKVSVDMERNLTEKAFSFVGGVDAEKQEVKLLPNEIGPADLHLISTLRTKLLSGNYHYVLMDQTALDMLIRMQALPDLNKVLPGEEVARWEEKWISIQTENEKYPVAIDITGTPLAAGCTFEGERIFLAFPVNKDTFGVVKPFYDYLMQQGLLTKP